MNIIFSKGKKTSGIIFFPLPLNVLVDVLPKDSEIQRIADVQFSISMKDFANPYYSSPIMHLSNC